MSVLQALGIYAVVGALVTFLVTLFFGDLNDDPPPYLIGLFWPIFLALAIIATPFLALYGIHRFALKMHKITRIEP